MRNALLKIELFQRVEFWSRGGLRHLSGTTALFVFNRFGRAVIRQRRISERLPTATYVSLLVLRAHRFPIRLSALTLRRLVLRLHHLAQVLPLRIPEQFLPLGDLGIPERQKQAVSKINSGLKSLSKNNRRNHLTIIPLAEVPIGRLFQSPTLSLIKRPEIHENLNYILWRQFYNGGNCFTVKKLLFGERQ